MSARRPRHNARSSPWVAGTNTWAPYQSDESYEAYDRLLAQSQRSVEQASAHLRTINEVVEAYWTFANTYYV